MERLYDVKSASRISGGAFLLELKTRKGAFLKTATLFGYGLVSPPNLGCCITSRIFLSSCSMMAFLPSSVASFKAVR